MLTLPSRSQSTARSSRRLSNGSTRIECRGLTPAGGPGARRERAPPDGQRRDRHAGAGQQRRRRRRARPGGPAARSASAWRNSSPVCQRSAGCFSSARMIAAASGRGVSGRTRSIGDRPLGDVLGDDDAVGPPERRRARQHLVGHHAEGVEVAPAVDLLAGGLLGAHVGRRAHRHALARAAGAARRPAMARAMPKSASIARPVAWSSSTFSGLTSRWTTPARPAASSAAAMSATIRATVGRIEPPLAGEPLPEALALDLVHHVVEQSVGVRRRRGPRRCSGWRSRAMVRASARKRRPIDWCAASSGCTTLMATRRSSVVSVARKTTPIPPRPSSRSSRYCGSSTAWSAANRSRVGVVIVQPAKESGTDNIPHGREPSVGCVAQRKGCSPRGMGMFRVESMLTSDAYPLAPTPPEASVCPTSPIPPPPPSPPSSCRGSGPGWTPPATGCSPCCTATRSPTRCGRCGSGRWTRCWSRCTAAAPTRWTCWATWCGSFPSIPTVALVSQHDPGRHRDAAPARRVRGAAGGGRHLAGRLEPAPPGGGAAGHPRRRPDPGADPRARSPRRRRTHGCSWRP